MAVAIQVGQPGVVAYVSRQLERVGDTELRRAGGDCRGERAFADDDEPPAGRCSAKAREDLRQ